MKKIILVLFVIGIGFGIYHHRRQNTLNPEVIANPTFAEIRMSLDARGRSFEQVLFAKTANPADCKRYSQFIVDGLQKKQANDASPPWVLKSMDCKPELESRHARLFDNQPSFVTYLSMARGHRTERETRLIYWGVSPQEADRVCDMVAKIQSGRMGGVTCIRAMQ